MHYTLARIVGGLFLVQAAWAAEPDAAILAAAQHGDAKAAVQLGDAYLKGEYGAGQDAQAAAWYIKAESDGSPTAALQLGVLYEVGRGVAQSYAKAAEQYQIAQQDGVQLASYRLAVLYYEGWGLSRDRAKALALLSDAANHGCFPAARMLSTIYHFGFGVTADEAKAIEWAEVAAKQDDPQAEWLLGILSQQKAAGAQGVAAGRAWLTLASDQEYSAAMVAMAHSYLNGTAATRDWALARRWLELALNANDRDAGILLAAQDTYVANLNHQPPPLDQIKAELEKAQQLGSPDAADIFRTADAFHTSLPEALRLYFTMPEAQRYVAMQAAKAAGASSKPTHEPQVVYIINPAYPEAMRATGLEGKVMVEFVVAKDGTVKEAKIVESDHPAFSANALEAVSQWHFLPGMKDGQAVDTRMRVPLWFNLSVITKPNSPAARDASAAPPGAQQT